jgi:hypothetical protein
MATLLVLKDEIEERFGSTMRMVFSGATEAHMLASSISKPLSYPKDEHIATAPQRMQA